VRLPRAEEAVIDPRKLVDYGLSETHPIGKHKAKVFASALGLTLSDAVFLESLILRAAIHEDARLTRADEYGSRYEVDFEATSTNRTARIRSVWIVPNFGPPRLITCYIL